MLGSARIKPNSVEKFANAIADRVDYFKEHKSEIEGYPAWKD